MKKQLSILLFLFIVMLSLKAQQPKLLVSNNEIRITKGELLLLQVDSIKFNFIKAKDIKIVSEKEGQWVLNVKVPLVTDFDKINGNEDKKVTIDVTYGKGVFHFSSHEKWARDISIYLKDLKESYYGISENLQPDNSKLPDLRGKVVDFNVTGDGYHIYENYASAWSAFFMTSKGYASFFNTFAIGRYYFGINGYTEIYHRTGNLDWYLFTGADGDRIMESYYSIIGKPKKVPMWACGPIIWRDDNGGGKEEILDDVQRFSDLKIPLTGLFVDRPYSTGTYGWSNMDFGNKFADPQMWISELNEKYGLEFMTWVATCTFGDKEFPGLFDNYFGYMDLTNQSAIDEMGARLKQRQYKYGVKGHKMDRADEHFPVAEPWKDGTPEWERRNKYAFLYSKVIDSLLVDSWGKNQFNFARTAMHGSQTYLSAIWGGDVRSSWDGLASNIANAVRSSFIGFPVWGTDVGGYLGEEGLIPTNLYARWLQWGVWNGLYEIKIDGPGGDGRDRSPWKYEQKLQSQFKDACDLRMQLLPYVYSLANTSSHTGVMMKPMAYTFPQDEKCKNIWDQYMFGNDILVAPVYNSNSSRKVYLPKGVWYDFFDNRKIYEGGKSFAIELSEDHIPVFVKSNGIYLTGKGFYAGNSKLWKESEERTLQIHVFPEFKKENNTFYFSDPFDNDKEKQIILIADQEEIVISIAKINAFVELILHGKKEWSAAEISTVDKRDMQNEDVQIVQINNGEAHIYLNRKKSTTVKKIDMKDIR